MKERDLSMSTGQLFVLIFTIGISLKMLMLPVLLLKAGGRSAALSLAGILLGEVLCLIVLGVAMKKAPQADFLTLVREATGKAGEKIVAALLFVYFFFKALLVSNETRVFFSEGLFSEFSWSVYALPFVAFCVLFGMGTARQVGRCAQFLFPFVVIATLVIFAFVSFGVDYGGLLPLSESFKAATAKNAAHYAMWYGDYSALVVFFGSVKRGKHTLFLTNLAGILASVAVLFFSLGLIAAFSDVGDVLRFGQNIAGLSGYTLLGPASGRFDLLVFCVWLVSGYIKAGVFLYAQSLFLSRLLGISRGAASAASGVLLYAAILFCGTSIGLRAFFGLIGPAALVVQFALPVFALVLSLLYKKRHKEKLEAQSDGQERPEAQERAPQTENGKEGLQNAKGEREGAAR